MKPEHLRTMMTWMLFGAGITFTILSVAVDYFVLFGHWSMAMEGVRLHMLGYKSIGYALGMLFVTGALAIGGPVGRFAIKASKDGLDVSADGDTTVTTTTETTVA